MTALSHSSQPISKVTMYIKCYFLELPTVSISSILPPSHQTDVLVCIFLFFSFFFLKQSIIKEERGVIYLLGHQLNHYSWAFVGNISFTGTIQYIICIKIIKRKSFRTKEDFTKKDPQERNGKGCTNLYSVIMSLKD